MWSVRTQYIGASVVVAGIIVTLIPTFFGHPTGGDDVDATTQIIWSGVQVLSCIPMCLSSVYKEKALGDDDMDVIYLNGWVAVFQFLASLLFAVPSAYAMGLPVSVSVLSYSRPTCFELESGVPPSPPAFSFVLFVLVLKRIYCLTFCK